MEVNITFILPTLNRRKFVKRAIDSCLACENNIVKPQVIVIDSQSEDGTFAYLQSLYNNDARVTLLQNDRTAGYMETSFQGVDLIETEYATFMFDDDVLSPYYSDMVLNMVKFKKRFIMGYGEVVDAEKIFPFKPIYEFKEYPNLKLLLGHFSSKEISLLKYLPVSEICCVVTSDLLREWVIHVKNFAQQNKLREYFMLKKNMGSDLMLHFLGMLQCNKALVASAVIAQFSRHPSSMSIRYKTINKRIGYWLPRIWAFEHFCKSEYRKEAAICASYLIIHGIDILLHKIKILDFSWFKLICKEIVKILFKVFKQRIAIATFSYRFPFLIKKKVKDIFLC